MISRPEHGSDPPIGSDQESGRDIPRVRVHQTTSVMMGDRIVKCVSTLPNDNKGGIHQTESVRNVN